MRSHGHGPKDIIAALARTTAAALQQQVETTLLLFDPPAPGDAAEGHRAPKRSRYTNAFGEVIRQLRLLGGRLPSDLTDEDLATNMSVAKAYVDVGLDELQRHLGDQAGLQIEEAQGGGATAAKALKSCTGGQNVAYRKLAADGDIPPAGGRNPSGRTEPAARSRARRRRGGFAVQTNLGTTVSVDSQRRVRNPTKPVGGVTAVPPGGAMEDSGPCGGTWQS